MAELFSGISFVGIVTGYRKVFKNVIKNRRVNDKSYTEPMFTRSSVRLRAT